MAIEGNAWPSLPLEKLQSTYETLRLWFQIVGKIRLSHLPNQVLIDFLQSTYAVAANLGKWDRVRLERTEHLGTLKA